MYKYKNISNSNNSINLNNNNNLKIAFNNTIISMDKSKICNKVKELSSKKIEYIQFKPEFIQDIYLYTHLVKENQNINPKEKMLFLYEIFKNSQELKIESVAVNYWLDILSSSYGYYLVYNNKFSEKYFDNYLINKISYIPVQNLIKKYC